MMRSMDGVLTYIQTKKAPGLESPGTFFGFLFPITIHVLVVLTNHEFQSAIRYPLQAQASPPLQL